MPGRFYAVCLLILVVMPFVSGNPIQTENALPGTTAWRLTNPATKSEIEGYASLTSVNIGGQILLFVNTTAPTYTIDVFRMGWYSGAGARLMTTVPGLSRIAQPAPLHLPDTGMIECNWTSPYILAISSTWVSGYYLAKLTASTGKQSYIIFVVREDSRPSAYLLQSSVTTFQAYNNWGGKSLYDFNSPDGASTKVSFNRPYSATTQGAKGVGAGEFLTNVQPTDEPKYPAGWEYNTVRFLEREGYDVTYCTDVDTHEQPNLLLSHQGYLSAGHDEYWSWEMRTNVTNARDKGVNLAFLGANAIYFQIRFEASPVSGGTDRTQVCYKNTDNDPVKGTHATIRWRDVGLPEDALIGVMYHKDPYNLAIVIVNASHWVFAGTGLKNGDTLPGLLGYEVDNEDGTQPANTVRLAHSPLDGSGGEWSDMTVYTAASGATVFATGSIQFSWGLDDDYNSPLLRPSLLSSAAQQMVRNVLAKFAQGSVAVSVSPSAVSLSANQTQAFTATVTGNSNTSVTWSISPAGVGSITSSGVYTAPASVAAQQTINIVATSAADGTKTGSASVTLNPVAVSVSPTAVALATSQSQPLTAAVTGNSNTAVTWSVSPAGAGSITTTGVYTAPASIPSQQTATVIATSVADATKSGSAIVTLTATSVTIAPNTASLSAGQSQPFTATVAGNANTSVTWSVSPAGVGNITAAGVYTAPASISSQQSVMVVATSVGDGTKSGAATVTLTPTSVTVGPNTASLTAGQGQPFTATVTGNANTSVTWSATPAGTGSITTAGIYTAPASVPSQQTVTVIATSVADNTKSGSALVTLMPISVSVSPTATSLTAAQSQPFTATVTGNPNTSVTWSATPAGTGSITTTGLYTAPPSVSSQQTVMVIATSVADSTKSSAATVTLTPIVVSVTPGAASLTAGHSQQFTASVPVTWSISPAGVGSITAGGQYTSPSPITGTQTVSVIATSAVDGSKTGTATVTLNPLAISVAPQTVSVTASQSQTFTATVTGNSNTAVTWSLSPAGAGSITAAGVYTAPSTIAAPQTVTVIATSAADATRSAAATVTLNVSVALSCSVPGSNSFTGCYYNDRSFNALALIRNDPSINFNWNGKPPAPNMGGENFTIRWQGSFTFQAGTYEFDIATDDGSLLYLDGNLILNNWGDHAAIPVSVTVPVTAGSHIVRVDYFQGSGGSSAQLSWKQVP